MQEKIAIVTDVNAGLDQLPKEKVEGIFVLRSAVSFEGTYYIDGIEITIDEFYRKLKSSTEVPKTAAPTMMDHYNLFNKLIEEQYTDVIITPISNKLSQIGNTFVKLWEEEYKDKINVYQVDTKCATYLQGYFSVRAKEMVQQGFCVKDIVTELERMSNSFTAFFVVDDLKYLVKNGRLSGAKGWIGSILKIKPILTFDDEGRIIPFEKIKTYTAAVKKAIQILDEKIQKVDKIKLIIIHSLRYDLAKEYYDIFKEKYKDKLIEEIDSHLITPAVACHVGCGVFGVGFFEMK